VKPTPLQLVVGKGGVGKSTVTAALAISSVRAGRRVLAVELGAPGGLARLFGCTPEEPGAAVEVRPGLSLAYIDGEAALAEYLDLVVPIRRLLAAVLASRVYRYFVAAAPGLKELMTVGKLWYEQQLEDGQGRRVWDTIVVDAGASGHSLQYLMMPTTAAETFRSGLVHREARRVESLLKDESVTSVHVVATPEDMPLAEAAQIVERLRGDLALPLGELFINRCRARSPEGVARALTDLEGLVLPAGAAGDGDGCEVVREGIVVAARRALSWEGIQERGIERLERDLGVTPVRLPLIVAEEFGRAEIDEIAACMGAHREAGRA